MVREMFIQNFIILFVIVFFIALFYGLYLILKDRHLMREEKAKSVLKEIGYDGSKSIREYSKKNQKKIIENLPYSGDYLIDLLNKPK